MTDYIDGTGLHIPTQAEIAESAKTNLITRMAGVLREDVDGPAYRLLVLMLSEAKSETLAALQLAVSGLLPDTSSGEMLKELLKFNGITINESAYSTGSVLVTAKSTGFNALADTVIVGTLAGDEYLITQPITLGAGASNTYTIRSMVKGRFIADVGDIDQIVTPMYGLDSVVNEIAVVPGRSTETDPAARSRRWRTARGTGLHHPSAIKRALEDLDGVTAVALDINTGATVSPSGVEPGTVRAVVWGGVAQEIADTLYGVGTAQDVQGFGSVAAGIGTQGTVATAVVDAASGQSGTIYHTVGSDVPIYIQVNTRKQAGAYPENGDYLIKDFIVQFFDGNLEINDIAIAPFAPGEDVVASRIYTAVNAVTGHSIQSIYIGRTNPPTSSADVTIDIDELAVTSESIITVVGV